MSSEDFVKETFRDENPFATQLERGFSIQSVTFESMGLDKDDDYIAFSLDFDFGNTKLDTT